MWVDSETDVDGQRDRCGWTERQVETLTNGRVYREMGRKRDRHTDGQTEKEVDMGRKMGI